MRGWVATLRELYEGETARAYRFRYGLLAFDVGTVLFIIVSSFLPRTDVLEGIDIAIGLVILADFSARLAVSRQRMRDLFRLSTLADLAAIVSFLAPVVGEGAAFLRVLRTLRLLYTYQI